MVEKIDPGFFQVFRVFAFPRLLAKNRKIYLYARNKDPLSYQI
ncbi:MAG: hypothetical protein NUV68_00630 [Caldiserica bacterium]|nr:hypothetical protein [Caldisericota bacterium]MDH7561864.1 hypothetical protein [Caldisericota bacterium]